MFIKIFKTKDYKLFPGNNISFIALSIIYQKKFQYSLIHPKTYKPTFNPAKGYFEPHKYEKEYKGTDLINSALLKNHIDPNLTYKAYLEANSKIIIAKYNQINGSKSELIDEAYYNQAEVYGRDMTIAVYKEYLNRVKKEKGNEFTGLNILDGVSGSGVLGIRLWKELSQENIKRLIFADKTASFDEFLYRNLLLNGIEYDSNPKIILSKKDINYAMFDSTTYFGNDPTKFKFDIINLEHSTIHPIKFFYNAVQAINDGGLISLTFTDYAAINGKQTTKGFYTYGIPRTKPSTVENGARMILSSLRSISNMFEKSITPILCFFSDYYYKIIIQVNKSKTECVKSMIKLGNIYQCNDCPNHHIVPIGHEVNKETENKPEEKKMYLSEKFKSSSIDLDLTKCSQCGGSFSMNGPIWISNLNDIEYMKSILDNLNANKENTPYLSYKKMVGIIEEIIQSSSHIDYPYAINTSHFTEFFKIDKMQSTTMKIIANHFRYTMRHSYFGQFEEEYKTNAPLSFWFDLARSWRRKLYPLDPITGIDNNASAKYAMLKPMKYTISYDIINKGHIDQIKKLEEGRPKLFFKFPDSNWGKKDKLKVPKNNDSTKSESTNNEQFQKF